MTRFALTPMRRATAKFSAAARMPMPASDVRMNT